LKLAAVSGIAVTLLAAGFSLLPIVPVGSVWVFAGKIAGTAVLMNLVAAGVYWRGRRRTTAHGLERWQDRYARGTMSMIGNVFDPICTNEDYQRALARLDQLMGARAHTPEGDELDALANLLVAYEEKHFPMGTIDIE
jgi:hypothetical protein